MSTVREHVEVLRKIATTLEQRGLAGHGNRQNSPQFQFDAVLLCGVHLDELEAMVNDRRPPADLTDMQIKALIDSSPELARLDYGTAYLLVRKIEAAANLRSAAGAQQQDDHAGSPAPSEPVATLHDDGHYTFKPGKEPWGARQAGWRMDVYAPSAQSSKAALSGEEIQKLAKDRYQGAIHTELSGKVELWPEQYRATQRRAFMDGARATLTRAGIGESSHE